MRFQLGLISMVMAVGCGPAVVVPNDDDDATTTGTDDGTSSRPTSDPMMTTLPPATSASTTFSTSPPNDDSGSSSAGSDEVSTFVDTGSVTAGVFCGNDVVEIREQCDGSDLQGLTCEDLGYTGGDLACTMDCLFDTEFCFESDCGDGMVAPGEQCDGEDLQGFDCESLGLGMGDLACDPVTCTFDTAGCMPR